MPELPEVETVRAGLEEHVVGHEIANVIVHRHRAIRLQEGGERELQGLLQGRTIAGAHRRGKYLWMTLTHEGECEDYALVVHLGMSGQLLIKEADPSSHTHLRVEFQLQSGRNLWFVDQRLFGYVAALPLTPDPYASGYIPAMMTHIGPDLLEEICAGETKHRAAVNRKIRKSNRGIKAILLDQEFVSGIGNIYADEALWRVGMHYARPASRLRAAQVEELLGAATDVLHEALEAGGTSFDELYVDVSGEQGYFERSLAAYGREGDPCERCGRIIVRETYQNRSSYRCPKCQRKPTRG